MFKDKILALRQEVASFSFAQKMFVLCAMLCSFCISAEYSIIRPVSNSLFITAYGSGAFPYVWLAAVPLNFLFVSLYNKYLPQIGCRNMFLISVSSVIVMNMLTAAFISYFSFIPFFFYVWKEMYVMVMFQQLWSVVHSNIKLDKAKYLYGIMFAFGGIGGVAGSFIPAFLALRWGTENLLWITLPVYLLLIVGYLYLLKHSDPLTHKEWEKKEKGSILEGMRLIRNSKPLLFILSIVVLMQVCTTITYFQFNKILETTIGDKDLRTEYYGWVVGIFNFVSVTLQTFGSFLLVHYLGLRRAHLFIPCSLLLNGIGSLAFPTFSMFAFSLITIKSFDVAIFNVIKEMLYIPLKREEKFQAKAVIDVFAYRASKAVGSFIILFYQLVGGSFNSLSWSSVALFGIWIFIVFRLFQMQGDTQPASSEPAPEKLDTTES